MEKFGTEYKNNYQQTHYDNVRLCVPKGQKDKLKQYANTQNMSLNKLINTAIQEYLENRGITL